HYLEGNGEELYDLKTDKGEQRNLAKDPKYSHVLAEHRAMLDDYIDRTGDDYRTLKVAADKQWRSHTPGYPNHKGPGARDINNRK
ncbi:MAG: sulfatase, partial [Bacteroides sp.]